MTTLTNDDDRHRVKHDAATDDLVHRVFARWDMDLHARLGETVPLDVVGDQAAAGRRSA